MKAYNKDFLKMFKNNFFRFVSIVLIIVLGTAFYVGMNSISPAMEKKAEKYLEEQNVFDVSLVSNLGYKDEDVERIEKLENVTKVEPIYSYDVLTEYNNKDVAVRLVSTSDEKEINKNYIISGEDVKRQNECLIDSRLQLETGFQVGDTIKVYRKDDVKLEDYVKEDEFKIVGITRNPVYLSKIYGNTELLTGELYGYITVSEEVFNMDYYSNVYIKLDIDSELNKFSDEYKDKLDKYKKVIEEENDKIVQGKFDDIYKENDDVLKDYSSQIDNAEVFVNDAKKKINDAHIKLNGSIAQLTSMLPQNSSSTNISNKNKIISDKYKELDQKQGELKQIKQDIKNAEEEYESLNKNLKQSDEGIEDNLSDLYDVDNESDYVRLNKELNLLYHQYNRKYDKVYDAEEKVTELKKQYDDKQKEINEVKTSIKENQNDLYNSFDNLKDVITSINSQEVNVSYSLIKSSREELEKNEKELEENNYDKQIEDAKNELDSKREDLESFKSMTEVTPLYENGGFKSLKDDLVKMKIMGRIFPVMFFVVAALVTITTITRMIEEDRKNIGTLKSLGYSKTKITARYVIYSLLATIVGLLLGTALGATLIIQILFLAYGSLYDLPPLQADVNIVYTGIIAAAAIIVTLIVTLTITGKELKENAAELMRPKAAKEGKRILLERIPIIWNGFSFLWKICFRNIFRYKKRLLMTIIGISGCTALIYAGLGLQASITEIGQKQFKEVRKFSMEVYFKQDVKEKNITEIEEYVNGLEGVKESVPVIQKSFTVESEDSFKEVYYVAIDAKELDKYFSNKDRKTNKDVKLSDSGIILTEKLANVLNVKAGDKVKVKDTGIEQELKVLGVTENYLYNYAYITPSVYEKIYNKPVAYNSILLNSENLDEDEQRDLAEKIKENDNISTVIVEAENDKTFQSSLQSLMAIVILFIACASLLSFVVLVNLNNINIEERKRELATFKVLGFHKRELESYVFRENIILTILGIAVGLLLGMGILGLIIQSAEVETIFLPKNINYPYLALSAAVTLAFTIITNLFMKRKIRKIDMIDSLKSIE